MTNKNSFLIWFRLDLNSMILIKFAQCLQFDCAETPEVTHFYRCRPDYAVKQNFKRGSKVQMTPKEFGEQVKASDRAFARALQC